MLAFILNLPLWGMFARFNCTLGTVQIPRDRLVPGLVSPFHAATPPPTGGTRRTRRVQRLGCQRRSKNASARRSKITSMMLSPRYRGT